MTSDKKIRVGISIGDLNGIGPEIILKSFEDQRMYDFCTPVVFASFKLMGFFKKHFGSKVNLFEYKNVKNMSPNKMNVVNVWREHVNVNFGDEDPEVGKLAIKSLKAAVAALKRREIDVLVTAPINKFNSQSEDFNFPGHTDYLAKELEGESLMFMVSDGLKVGLLTDHVPVKDVPQHINKELILSKIQTVTKSLKEDFRVSKPKIAVLSINPHAGDQGVIGKEDDEILKPTLEELRADNQLVYGPYAADSFFGNKAYESFDAIIASYHDQGLIPFKTITFGEGVNYTAGLSKIRTSPDHGTAFEIAGKGVADEGSFKIGIFMALKIYKNRLEYSEYAQNPLQVVKD
ncbi:MAG: 4-hydroxythreonine-4-phosphate dehydrogenase PdxA [Bacteroidota bacterium]